MSREDRKVDLIEKRTVFDGYFQILRYRLKFALHEGGMSEAIDREIFERGQVAAVLPVDPILDQVVLIEQFRIGPYAVGWDPWLLEGVAGIIEEGESAEDVAIRETREEAGCEITDLVPMMRYLSSPGACSETVALFCGRVNARDAGGVHGLDEEHEDIKVIVYSVDEALEMLKAGKIVNGKTIIALQWLALNYAQLKRRWLG
ncbi:MAG TPA: NUDIX domain-containing protein [Gammaproteobacteria bacterium]|nr:NUDIX domain-containing protein [Gammaproteobacteria bacterium]